MQIDRNIPLVVPMAARHRRSVKDPRARDVSR
jgi:hypothetical protein